MVQIKRISHTKQIKRNFPDCIEMKYKLDVIKCYVMFIKPGRYSGSWFALIHSQNVNWITTAQINPRHEKMQIIFYINQVHLWNNSMFLETICFVLFCTRFSICIYIFFYLYIFILEMLGTDCFKAYGIVTRSKHCVTRDSSDYLTYKTKQNLNVPFYPFSHLLMLNLFFDKKKRTGV